MFNIVECFAILLIIGAMILIYMRAGKKEMAIAMLPIVFVPFMHIVAWGINLAIKGNIMVQSNAYIVLDLVGLAVAAVTAGICSSKFKKKIAVVYVSVVMLFSIALTAILIINNLNNL